jgi:tetratricopeptide (TPR) repeat protein
VAAFTEALEPPVQPEGAEGLSIAAAPNPPGLLLLSIARSYFALDEFDAARAYLVRCIEVSPDSNNITAARLLLGEIMRKTDDNSGAEAQYRTIIGESGDNAEAHYQLGELYAAQGDTAKARAEWRDALKADSAHTKARTRLSM